ncbi:hypothetical protein L227DRAFT_610234 [Lentinus tigrinus ALCF2SS1-6]|uniref:Uncharacterized protein n=1 Tax=Lentinus tigrinus ALCF2SS1-6 TaxID=1328759 RepID=A0A5C2SK15_9APHY|nr:hypothetical protein L227DRAFT_610234 [Lentinus tigrinus ALCF2SS1-6]
MDGHSLRISPQWTPRPLQPSPWNTPQISPVSATPPDLHPDHAPPIPPLYLSTVARPTQEPNDIIHDFYNVAPVSFRLDAHGTVPQTVDMPLLHRSSSRPTHALAVLSSLGQPPPVNTAHGLSVHSEHSSSVHPPPSPSSPSSPYTPVHADPYLLPIDATLFSTQFGHDVARSLASVLPMKPTSALVRRDRLTGTQLVTLPLIPLYVPHPPSIPHLLLFGQRLPISRSDRPAKEKETPNYSRPTISTTTTTTARPLPSSPSFPPPLPPLSPSTLATYLLPISAIEEFPSAPAMAEIMARQCSEEELRDRVVFNQGLWRNVLLLAPTDPTLVDLARVAWNVTAEARRLRRAASLSRRSEAKSPRFREVELPVLNVQYADAAGLTLREETIQLAPVPMSRRPSRRRSRKNLKS